MDWAVETWSLSKSYREAAIVKDLNLKVSRGSVFVLFGPNGAGKSTALKLLVGLKHPSGGGGRCLGLDIATKGLQIRKKVGYMGEEPRFYNYMNVRQLLKFCSGLYHRWDNRLAERSLEAFHLSPGDKVDELSQGIKNQLALILALAPRPELLILDEPTTGFDPLKRRIFYDIILREVVTEGGTVLMTSHQLHEVERIADQVGLMRSGKLVRTCSTDDLKSEEKEIRVVFQKEPPPDFFQRPGVRKVERDGAAYRVLVTDHLEEIWQACASFPHYALELVSVDLEEMFVRHIERGDKND